MEEYRFVLEAAHGDARYVLLGFGQVPPGRVRDLNHLTHAACCAGLAEIAAALLRMVGRRATSAPRSCGGDPDDEFMRWCRRMLPQR